MSPTPEIIWEKSVREFLEGRDGPSADVRQQLEVLRREIVRDTVERCAQLAEKWALNYPTDVFPESGTSKDCESARFARHTSRMIAKQIRESFEDEDA